MSTKRQGKIYLIGAGPGDIELLTLKAVRCLQEADVVLLDSLVNPDILQFTKSGAKIVYAGKRGGKVSTDQAWIGRQLVLYANDGLTVARVKGGDPLIFARGGEELAMLAEAGINAEIVSGITAGLGIPAALGIPLTHRDLAHHVTFMTGHGFGTDEEPPLPLLHAFNGTLVIYMGLNKAEQIMSSLLTRGLPRTTPVAAVQAGTTNNQRCLFAEAHDFAERLAGAQLVSPVLIIVGEVVRLSPYASALPSSALNEVMSV